MGLNTSPRGTNTFTGARAIFKVDDKKIAYASGVNGSEEIMYEPVEVLDNLEVQEYVPVAYRVSFSCDMFRTITGSGSALPPKEGAAYGSVKQMGLFPKPATDLTDVLTSGVLTCTIQDRVTGKVVMQLQECKVQNVNFRITARGLVSEDLRWVAIRMKDESEIGA